MSFSAFFMPGNTRRLLRRVVQKGGELAFPEGGSEGMGNDFLFLLSSGKINLEYLSQKTKGGLEDTGVPSRAGAKLASKFGLETEEFRSLVGGQSEFARENIKVNLIKVGDTQAVTPKTIQRDITCMRDEMNLWARSIRAGI